MKNKNIILYLVLISIIMLVGCSSGSKNSNIIDIDYENLKFNEDAGNNISSKFGIALLDITATSVEWYNTYVDNSTDEYLITLNDSLEKIIVGDMQELFVSDSMNDIETKIYEKCLNIGKEISIRTKEELQIENEEILRDKNLKEISDEEYNKLLNKRENHINTIKVFITDILDKYFDLKK